jgi:hypothetical protein
MAKARITKDDLAQGIAMLQIGHGLEAKFYWKGGVKVVMFECMADAAGMPEVSFRIGRKSALRHGYTDVDNAWNILTVDYGMEPPKELVPIAIPEKIRTKEPKPFVECEEMNGVLTDAQAMKIAEMMLYAADYEGAWLKFPQVHIAKYQNDNEQKVATAMREIFKDLGIMSEDWTRVFCFDSQIHVGETAVALIHDRYGLAPIYTDNRMRRVTLYRGFWMNGNKKSINSVYVDAYQPTGEYDDAARIDNRLMRQEREWERFVQGYRSPAKEQAYRDAERRVEDYEQRKDTFCHGIGQRRIKLFLNACIKNGDEVAQMYRLALEVESVNLNAKKALKKYHSDYHSYDKKEACLRQLSDKCKQMSVVFGIQASTAPAARYVVYYELPGCEQISFHTNEPEAAGWPHYDGKWDGKKCSTLGKLEEAIWKRYENELKSKYNL